MKCSLYGLSVIAIASLGGLCACNSNNACTDVSCFPTVAITPEEPLGEAGDYVIDFVADGKKMTCTLTVPGTAAPHCTDQRAFVAQKSGVGITSLSVEGDLPYRTVSVTVERDGETIAAQTFSSLKYVNGEFTGFGCAVCPTAPETLRTGNGPDASAPLPDASIAVTPDASGITAKDAAVPARLDAAVDAR